MSRPESEGCLRLESSEENFQLLGGVLAIPPKPIRPFAKFAVAPQEIFVFAKNGLVLCPKFREGPRALLSFPTRPFEALSEFA
jgi:hypothetical protein